MPAKNPFYSSKLALLLLFLWIGILELVAFYALGVFRFLNVTPQESDQVNFYLSASVLNIKYLFVFSLINGLVILLALTRKNVTKIFLKYIDPLLVLLGAVGLTVAYTLPCEGLSCIGNGFLAFGSVFILGLVVFHAPILYLAFKGARRRYVGIIALVFLVLITLIPYLTYKYQKMTLPQKAVVGISQAREQLGIVIFKPAYLPNKTITKQFEGVRDSLGEYYLNYYFKQANDSDLGLTITEQSPKGGLEELLENGGRSTTINNNPAAISTLEAIQNDSTFSTSIVWVSNGTEIKLGYGFERGTKESVETEALKIAESMKTN